MKNALRSAPVIFALGFLAAYGYYRWRGVVQGNPLMPSPVMPSPQSVG